MFQSHFIVKDYLNNLEMDSLYHIPHYPEVLNLLKCGIALKTQFK